MPKDQIVVAPADVTPSTEEGPEAGSFFAAAFDKLKTDGVFDASTDDDAAPAAAVKPADDNPPADEPPATDEPENPFSAAKLLGLDEDETPADEPEKPAEDEDGDDIPTPDLDTPEKQKAWAKVRAENKTFKTRVKELEAALEAERTAAKADPEEVTTLRQQLDAAEQELVRGRVQASRYFKEAVEAPRAQIRTVAEAIAKKAGDVTAEQVVAALQEPDGNAMSDIAAGLSEFDRNKLYRLAEQQAQVDQTEALILERAKEASELISKKEKEDAERQKQANRKAYETALGSYRERVSEALPFLKRRDGATAWNAQLDELDEFAGKIDIDDMPAPARAELVYRAGLIQPVLTLLTTLQKEYQAAQAKLGKYQKSKPSLGGGAATETAPSNDEDEDTGFVDVLRKSLR